MPELGNDVAQLSRSVFFPLAVRLAFLAIMSGFYWSACPFDIVCREYCPILIKRVCLCHTHAQVILFQRLTSPSPREHSKIMLDPIQLRLRQTQSWKWQSMRKARYIGSATKTFFNVFQLCLISSTRPREKGRQKSNLALIHLFHCVWDPYHCHVLLHIQKRNLAIHRASYR